VLERSTSAPQAAGTVTGTAVAHPNASGTATVTAYAFDPETGERGALLGVFRPASPGTEHRQIAHPSAADISEPVCLAPPTHFMEDR
jgi:hypothetical protein